jgi:hypothetical protein
MNWDFYLIKVILNLNYIFLHTIQRSIKVQMVKKTRYIKPKKSEGADVATNEIIKKENLPFPFVHYPAYYGTFIAFSKTENDHLYFCSCIKPSIDNFLKINQKIVDENVTGKLLNTHLIPLNAFPKRILNTIKLSNFGKSNLNLLYEKNLCHKCNLSTPSVRFTSKSYGGNFEQYFGWYIRQKLYKIGIQHYLKNFSILEDVCPYDYIMRIKKIKELFQIQENEYTQFLEVLKDLNKDNLPSDEITKIQEVKNRQLVKYKKCQQRYETSFRAFWNDIENNVRNEFGFNKIGEGWISESILHKIITKIYSKETVIRNHRPTWLEGLELDCYLPDLKIGFEYQGKQHYFPIDAWGGIISLKKVQERDLRKKELCKILDIKLIVIDYTEALTEENIRHLINQSIQIL